MKTISTFALAFATLAMAQAGTFHFTPPGRADLDDLDHYYAYSWGVDWKVPQGEFITGAQITIKNIWNWKHEENILHVRLLDNPGSGVKQFYDNQGGGDYFAGKGFKVGTWTDTTGGVAKQNLISFDLKQAGLLDELTTFAADGKFGFGFDPDCHFWNDGVKLTITTAPVPEPATMTVLALGAAAALRRKRKSA